MMCCERRSDQWFNKSEDVNRISIGLKWIMNQSARAEKCRPTGHNARKAPCNNMVIRR